MTTSPKIGSEAGPSVLVVGIGNEIRGDDAIGLAVAEAVSRALDGDDRPVVVKPLSAGGWQLLHEIEGFDQLIVIDAYLDEAGRPGRVRVFGPEEMLPVRDIDTASAHLLSIPDALRLSEKHGYHTPKLLGVVTVDVPESCLTFGVGLSNPVKAAINPAVAAVLALIGA